MIGFEGDGGDQAWRARVHEALAVVLGTFPEHVDKPKHPTWFEPHEIAENELFDAIVRSHKKNRLALPMRAVLGVGAPYHGFSMMHARRLAWFVPSMLAAWLDRGVEWELSDFTTYDLERITAGTEIVAGDSWAWTDEETAALATFFDAALSAALATPLRAASPASAAARERARPREDGIDVWSRYAPSVPLDVIRAARALRVEIEPLVAAWVSAPSALALDHLLEAVFDPTVPAKRFLADERVADRLGDAFFTAEGERALRLSKAEVHVRRWIVRREDM